MIGALVALTELDLSRTNIEGTLNINDRKNPYSKLWFSQANDHRLWYDSNPRTTRAHFAGSIPPEIGALVALTYLSLYSTNVEGASGLI